MKKEKGFTLVELLVVIVIIGLLGLIAYPAISNLINDSRSDLANAQEQSIKNAAKNWVSDHPYSIPKYNGDELIISLCQLKIGSYIEPKLINPITNNMYDDKTKIVIKNNSNKYEYVIDFTDTQEESVIDKAVYPSIKFDDNYLVYIKKNEKYDEPVITINDTEKYTYDESSSGVFIPSNENNHYSIIVTYNKNNRYIDTSQIGNNLVIYTVVDNETNKKITIYRNVIVVDE